MNSNKSGNEDEFVYSRYLGSMLLDTVIERNIADKTICIENEIQIMNQRLDQSRKLLDETNQDIKEINFLCKQSSLLKREEKILQQALDNEHGINQSTNLEELRTTLQFSANSLPTRKVILDDDISQISLESINKLNAALTKLNVGLKGLSKTHKSTLEEIDNLTTCVTTSDNVLEELQKLGKSNGNSLNKLNKTVITGQSIELDIANL